MKQRILIFLGMVLIACAVQSAAKELEFDPKWKSCSKSTQCVVLRTLCDKGAFNRRYAEQAGAFYRQIRKDVTCPEVVASESPLTAACIHEECATAPANNSASVNH